MGGVKQEWSLWEWPKRNAMGRRVFGIVVFSLFKDMRTHSASFILSTKMATWHANRKGRQNGSQIFFFLFILQFKSFKNAKIKMFKKKKKLEHESNELIISNFGPMSKTLTEYFSYLIYL